MSTKKNSNYDMKNSRKRRKEESIEFHDKLVISNIKNLIESLDEI